MFFDLWGPNVAPWAPLGHPREPMGPPGAPWGPMGAGPMGPRGFIGKLAINCLNGGMLVILGAFERDKEIQWLQR